MNIGDQLTIDGRTAEVVEVRKSAPVAVVMFGNSERRLHWYGGTEATDTATGPGYGPGGFADNWIETHTLRPINNGPTAEQLAEQWGLPAESAGDGLSVPSADTPVQSPSLPSRRHETPRQARTWQEVYGWYNRAGLCPRCSAQGAWGHQLGFSNVKPPCNPCAVIVAKFPAKVSNSWHRLHRRSAPQYALTARA